MMVDSQSMPRGGKGAFGRVDAKSSPGCTTSKPRSASSPHLDQRALCGPEQEREKAGRRVRSTSHLLTSTHVYLGVGDPTVGKLRNGSRVPTPHVDVVLVDVVTGQHHCEALPGHRALLGAPCGTKVDLG